ncbi:MAG: hypothetical protein NVSMB9_23330 [Isosphaeraceae bacterium]
MTSELPGRGGRLGHYELIERVGQGRQADVWRARSKKAGLEEVALKVLPPAQAARDPRRRAQLRHEAERGTRIVGPSLLPTYDYGEDSGAVFMAMPLVIGSTLAAILQERRERRAGRRPLATHWLAEADDPGYTRVVVDLIARVALAAAVAHAGRVVHRDIKPANILVGDDPRAGVFLCDFGLARDLDVATPSQLRDGSGSPLYMAPERLQRGTADEVRADVFSLGVTLFEALTLTTPIQVPSELGSDCWTTFLTSTTPRRPSAVWPAIPPALEEVILRATSREPARRHPTARHLADDLMVFVRETRSRRPRFS